MMRVAIDCRTLLARKTGDRTYIANLIRHLPAADADAHYFYLLDHPPEKASDDLSWLSDLPGEVHVLPSLSPRWWTAVTLPAFARRWDVDLIHVQYIVPPFSPCRLITTIHDLSFFHFPECFPLKDRLLLRYLIPFSTHRADVVITGSENSRRDLMEICRLPQERVFVTPYAADEMFHPVTDESQLDAVCNNYGLARPFWLFVGVLQPRKNLARLLHAYHLVARENVNIPLLAIAGKRGWGEREIFALVARLHLGERVRFLDYVPENDLPALYSAADAFLYPSLYEGFGLPVLEAMSCGTLVLASDTSSLPEVVGDAGILVDPSSVESIAAGLTRLLRLEEDERDRMRQRGLERAAVFSWEKTARLTVEVYRKALTRPRSEPTSS